MSLDYELNVRMMKELGLETGDRRRVIDRDSEEVCCLGTRDIVSPGSQSGKNAVEFDVVNNPRMMNKLFSEFVDKLAEEGSIDSPCISYGTYESYPDKKITAKAIFEDGSSINSSSYVNESMALIDLVFQLNDEDTSELKKYDHPKETRKIIKDSSIKKKTPSKRKSD